jgi:cytochrome c oxidase cbb3-type subunit 3
MYQNVLQSMHEIQVWPVIGLIIFFIFFIMVIIVVMKTDPKIIEKMKNIPFENDADNTSIENQPKA